MSFSFIQITDHHLRERDDALSHGFNPAYAFRKVLEHIATYHAADADFLVTTGDIADNGTDAEYQATWGRLNLEFQATEPPGPHLVSGHGLARLPMYFLPGNHDPRATFFKNLYPTMAARAWNNSAFLHKGIQFVCIDWGGETVGVAHPAMLEFLAQRLESNAPTIIFSHHPVVRVGVDWLDDYLAADVDKFWDVVRGKNVLGIFTGHLHMTYERVMENIPVYGLRATTFQFALTPQPMLALMPPHYRVVTVIEGMVKTEIVQVEL